MRGSSRKKEAVVADAGEVGAGERGRRGRRPGASSAAETREAIERVAREQFAELGYEKVSVRGIARAADVDPKLVHHYFGGKEALFATIVQLPLAPGDVVAELSAPSAGSPGTRLARIILDLQANTLARMTMMSIIRAVANEKHAAERIRTILTQRMLEPMARELGVDRPELRASLVGSQVVGLMMARHVVKLPALVAVADEELAELLAATIDAALGVGNAGAAGAGSSGAGSSGAGSSGAE